MNHNPPLIEAASLASWTSLVEPTSPARTWAVICEKEVDIAEAHRNAVRAHFTADFDLERALKLIHPKLQRADWFKTSVTKQEKLGVFLKQWARTNAG